MTRAEGKEGRQGLGVLGKGLLVFLCACDWSLHRMQEQPKCTTHAALDGQPCDLLPPAAAVPLGTDRVPPRRLAASTTERGGCLRDAAIVSSRASQPPCQS